MAERRRATAGHRDLVLLGCALLTAVVFLAVGSVQRRGTTAAARIAHLESVLKCPSCTDLSIGQSRDNVALALDALVQREVRAGASDATIERQVLERYPGAILVPQGGVGFLAYAIPAVLLVAGALGGGALLLSRRRARPRTAPRGAPMEGSPVRVE